MGRNPVVGRQGPVYYAATIPPENAAKRVRVKQIRSAIGKPVGMRRTLEALGLKRHQATVELPNNASIRGMLFKVRHMVEVAGIE
jgi:large subunit ribosomal protein L30